MLNRISPHLGTPAQLRLAATEPTCEEDKCSEAISSISKHWTHPPSSLKHVPTTPSQQPHRQLEAFRHVTEQFGSTSQLEPRLSRSLRGRHYGIAIPPSSSPRHERRHTRRHTFDLPPGPSFLPPTATRSGAQASASLFPLRTKVMSRVVSPSVLSTLGAGSVIRPNPGFQRRGFSF